MKYKTFNLAVLKLALILIVIIAMFGSTEVASAYVRVRGYYRSDGTYVKPYVRSNPNGLKYDNYGYKSSQGRYNATYGTRGSSWDTPTYTTDPDYYKGKALYQSGRSGGSESSSGGSVSGGNSVIVHTYNKTDFNKDGKVGILDFNAIITNWGTASGATKAMGDANGDGKVDIFDFNILINNWPTS